MGVFHSRYADRAKRIKIKLHKNVSSVDVHVAQYAKVVEGLKAKIAELERENSELKREKETQKTAAISSEELEELEMLRTKLADYDEMKEKLKEYEEKAQNDLVKKDQSDLAGKDSGEPVKRASGEPVKTDPAEKAHKETQFSPELDDAYRCALTRSIDAKAACKKLLLKLQYARRILARAALVSAQNEKVERYVAMLEKKLRKAERREKRNAAALEGVKMEAPVVEEKEVEEIQVGKTE